MRHRLLAEDVLPRLGRGNRLRGVQVHRRGDVDGVDRRVADEIFPARVPALGAERPAQTPPPESARARLTAASELPGASRNAAATRFRAMSPAPMSPNYTHVHSAF